MDPANYSNLYRTELFENVIPFWMEHSIDKQNGGFNTCLLRNGKVYDTDKFVWLQARQVWTFSMLYNQVMKNQRWLDTALHGANFLRKYGHDPQGAWYFSLTADGNPLVAPYSIFSDCFACMAFGQLYLATRDEEHALIALETFNHILKRQDSPKGVFEKRIRQSRPLKNFALPMILSNLCLEIEHLLEPDTVNTTAKGCIDEIMGSFFNEETGLIHEHVVEGADFSSFAETRLLSPGHAIEAMGFIMDLGIRWDDNSLVQRAVDIVLHTLEFSWDEEYQGIYYYLDSEGYPLQQLEWDQKLWWVHLETIVALLKGYLHTGNERCWSWFEAVHEYAWSKFRDPEYGEWWGYLDRTGQVLLQLKGGKWKGCFHVPRALFQGWKILDLISEQQVIR